MSQNLTQKTPQTLTFVTGNAKKFQEVRSLLKDFPLEIIGINLDLPELQGDINEISIKKCQEAARLLKIPVVVEDTCLCFNALNGLPGPYIKWFEKKLGPEGLFKLLSAWEDKSAEAVCTFAYCNNDTEDLDVILFQHRTRGRIVPPRGKREFVWDSVFQPEGSSKTYGELTVEEKNEVSHRRIPLEALRTYFKNLDN